MGRGCRPLANTFAVCRIPLHHGPCAQSAYGGGRRSLRYVERPGCTSGSSHRVLHWQSLGHAWNRLRLGGGLPLRGCPALSKNISGDKNENQRIFACVTSCNGWRSGNGGGCLTGEIAVASVAVTPVGTHARSLRRSIRLLRHGVSDASATCPGPCRSTEGVSPPRVLVPTGCLC